MEGYGIDVFGEVYGPTSVYTRTERPDVLRDDLIRAFDAGVKEGEKIRQQDIDNAARAIRQELVRVSPGPSLSVGQLLVKIDTRLQDIRLNTDDWPKGDE